MGEHFNMNEELDPFKGCGTAIIMLIILIVLMMSIKMCS